MNTPDIEKNDASADKTKNKDFLSSNPKSETLPTKHAEVDASKEKEERTPPTGQKNSTGDAVQQRADERTPNMNKPLAEPSRPQSPDPARVQS